MTDMQPFNLKSLTFENKEGRANLTLPEMKIKRIFFIILSCHRVYEHHNHQALQEVLNNYHLYHQQKFSKYITRLFEAINQDITYGELLHCI